MYMILALSHNKWKKIPIKVIWTENTIEQRYDTLPHVYYTQTLCNNRGFRNVIKKVTRCLGR